MHGEPLPGEGSMADYAHAEGARTVHLRSLGPQVHPLHDTRALAAIASLIRRFRPDLIHTHTAKAGFLGRQAALLAVRKRDRPVLVHTFHGHVLEGYFGPLKTGLYKSLERRLGRASDCLIGVSEATVDDLVRLGVAPRERFRVVRLGLDLGAFASLDEQPGGPLREELGVGNDEVLLSFVGRLVPIKRVDVLLRAFARARGQGAPVRLAVVGDGEERSELELLASELGIAPAVSFIGYRRDLPAIAGASDAAVLSSDNEGTPVSLIEASAAARPAVATSVGGTADVITPETGILVPAGDHESLGEGIAQLAADAELRRAMGERAREHVLRRYSAERLVSDIDSLYAELLEGRIQTRI